MNKTNKKSMLNKALISVLCILLCFTVLCACNKEPEQSDLPLLITGDIEGDAVEINLYLLQTQEVKDSNNYKYMAYNLKDALQNVQQNKEEGWLLITAKDKVSARININDAHLVYVVENNGSLNIVAPSHPPVASIKDIEEITFIEKVEQQTPNLFGDDTDDDDEIIEPNNGVKVIDLYSQSKTSNGNLRLMYFDQVAENYKLGVVAYKHMPKPSLSVYDMFNNFDSCLLYFDNFDIIKADGSEQLDWINGRVAVKQEDNVYYELNGVIKATDSVLFDAYYQMKASLDEGTRVMFILPDGLSIEQVEHYEDDLSLLGDGYQVAASVHPAISNVALASIITGKSPYHTGITQRGVKPPAYSDIFEYAINIGKSVCYIEGNSNLINTSIDPILTLPDINGYTDTAVFNRALIELEKEPDFIFIHFHGIDDVNHEYSPISEEAKNKILKTEMFIEQLIDNFTGTVIILPDHGAITYMEDDIPRGKHGVFEKGDMLIPYYCIYRE